MVVVNAAKVAVSGNKRTDKRYYRHSGYPGGLRSRTLDEMLDRRPEEVIRLAVRGMLPRNRLSRQQIKKLKVYAGPEHPHRAQEPKPMEIGRVTDENRDEEATSDEAKAEEPAAEAEGGARGESPGPRARCRGARCRARGRRSGRGGGSGG